jgi:hypothetical protein
MARHPSKTLKKICELVDLYLVECSNAKDKQLTAAVDLPVTDCVELARVLAALSAVYAEGCPGP